MSFLESSEPLWSEIASIVDAEGLLLYDIERLGAASLRVIIDRDKSRPREDESEGGTEHGGVTSHDCTRVCRRLMIFFSAEGAHFGVSSEPELDVCSPGINRHLRLPEHYSRAIGERVKVVRNPAPTGEPAQIKPVVIGKLEVFDTSSIVIDDEELRSSIAVELSTVKRANVDFRF